MKKKLFLGNWKCYLSIEESISLFQQVSEFQTARYDVAFAPNHLALHPCSRIPSFAALAVQDCYVENQGAYTGFITPQDCASLGVRYCIIGHSERRRLALETDTLIAQKVSAVLKAGMTPVLCVGETKEQFSAGKSSEVIALQIQKGLYGISDELVARCVIAYEPVYAISKNGNGVSITRDSANAMFTYIQSLVPTCGMLYGGSVNPENLESFMEIELCDGVLVGSASTKFESLRTMLSLAF